MKALAVTAAILAIALPAFADEPIETPQIVELTDHEMDGIVAGGDIQPFAYGGAGWLPVVGDWDGDQSRASDGGSVIYFTGLE